MSRQVKTCLQDHQTSQFRIPSIDDTIKLQVWDVPQPQQSIIIQQLSVTIGRVASRFNTVAWSTDANAKTLLEIPSPILPMISLYLVDICLYCLTKISIRAKRSISRVFSLFIVPSPFLYIARTKAVLTGLKAY